MSTLRYPVHLLSTLVNFTCYVNGVEILSAEPQSDRTVVIYGKLNKRTKNKNGSVWLSITGQVEITHHTRIRREDRVNKASGTITILEDHQIKTARFDIKQGSGIISIAELDRYLKELPPSYMETIKASSRKVDLNDRLQTNLFY